MMTTSSHSEGVVEQATVKLSVFYTTKGTLCIRPSLPLVDIDKRSFVVLTVL
jgi:hypothetical protein